MGSVIDALAPLPSVSNFPLPNLVQSSGPGQPSYNFESPRINGLNMPGQWLLTGADRVFGWEEQVGNYLTGATLVPKGDPLLLATYSVRIWTSGDAGVYTQLLKTLLKKPVISLAGTSSGIISPIASSAALGIDDPALKSVGVTSVVVWSVTPLFNPLVTSGGKGPWTATVQFKEYRKQIPALPLPDQTIADPGPVTPSSTNSANQADANVAAQQGALGSSTASALLNH